MQRSTSKTSLAKTLSLTAAAFATVMIAGASVPGAVTSAEARSHRHHAHGHGHGHRHHGHHGHHRHHGHGHYFISSGYGGCYWMKERARDTGSRYWWNRYKSCIGD